MAPPFPPLLLCRNVELSTVKFPLLIIAPVEFMKVIFLRITIASEAILNIFANLLASNMLPLPLIIRFLVIGIPSTKAMSSV